MESVQVELYKVLTPYLPKHTEDELLNEYFKTHIISSRIQYNKSVKKSNQLEDIKESLDRGSKIVIYKPKSGVRIDQKTSTRVYRSKGNAVFLITDGSVKTVLSITTVNFKHAIFSSGVTRSIINKIIEHNNVAKILDMEVSENKLTMLMDKKFSKRSFSVLNKEMLVCTTQEYMPGTLKEYIFKIFKDDQFDEKMKNLLKSIHDTLYYLHSTFKFYHGDLYMRNILMEDDQPKLIDFDFSGIKMDSVKFKLTKKDKISNNLISTSLGNIKSLLEGIKNVNLFKKVVGKYQEVEKKYDGNNYKNTVYFKVKTNLKKIEEYRKKILFSEYYGSRFFFMRLSSEKMNGVIDDLKMLHVEMVFGSNPFFKKNQSFSDIDIFKIIKVDKVMKEFKKFTKLKRNRLLDKLIKYEEENDFIKYITKVFNFDKIGENTTIDILNYVHNFEKEQNIDDLYKKLIPKFNDKLSAQKVAGRSYCVTFKNAMNVTILNEFLKGYVPSKRTGSTNFYVTANKIMEFKIFKEMYNLHNVNIYIKLVKTLETKLKKKFQDAKHLFLYVEICKRLTTTVSYIENEEYKVCEVASSWQFNTVWK